VGDIGLMGGPAKLDGKAVEGVRIMVRSAQLCDPDPNLSLGPGLDRGHLQTANASLAIRSRPVRAQQSRQTCDAAVSLPGETCDYCR